MRSLTIIATAIAVIYAVVLTVLLSGCGQQIRFEIDADVTPSQAIADLLASDGPGAKALSESGEELDAASAALVDDLAAGLADELGPYEIPDGGGQAVAPVRTVVPGLDEPIELMNEIASGSKEVSGRTITESGRVQGSISDQSLGYVLDATKRVSQGEEKADDSRQSKLTIPVCAPNPDGKVSAEWTLERRINDVTAEGGTVKLELSASATVTSGAGTKDPLTVDGFTIRATRTTTTADGERTVDNGTLSGRFGSWGSDVIPTQDELNTLRDIDSDANSDWFGDEIGKLVISTLGASTLEWKAMLATALEARQQSGLCVSIKHDTGGVTTLKPGGSAEITAWVVDTRTGERIADARLEASTSDGSVSPDAAPAEATFAFTAGPQPPAYTVYLETDTPLGGANARVVFTGGWTFEPVELSITVVDGPTGYQHWSGYVCGDPFTEPWHFTQVVDGFVVEYDLVVPPLGQRGTSEYGQVPMIAAVVNPGPDEPPFQLFIDDVEPPEVTPRTQRVEVVVVPATTECE
ncbi:hypothetical protein BH10ACT7_BH10ACT7_05500 [soil metagenome]